MKLPIKDPAELKLVRFEFGSEIEAGQTISSVTVTSEVVAGTDPAPAAMLVGVPQIDNTNLYVLQRVDAGVSGADYLLRALATDSAGLKHLVYATLPVRTPQAI